MKPARTTPASGEEGRHEPDLAATLVAEKANGRPDPVSGPAIGIRLSAAERVRRFRARKGEGLRVYPLPLDAEAVTRLAGSMGADVEDPRQVEDALTRAVTAMLARFAL